MNWNQFNELSQILFWYLGCIGEQKRQSTCSRSLIIEDDGVGNSRKWSFLWNNYWRIRTIRINHNKMKKSSPTFVASEEVLMKKKTGIKKISARLISGHRSNWTETSWITLITKSLQHYFGKVTTQMNNSILQQQHQPRRSRETIWFWELQHHTFKIHRSQQKLTKQTKLKRSMTHSQEKILMNWIYSQGSRGTGQMTQILQITIYMCSNTQENRGSTTKENRKNDVRTSEKYQ